MILDKMLFLFAKSVMGILDLGRFSEKALDFAVEYTLSFAKLLGSWLSWSGGRESVEADSAPMAIHAAATASAEGLAPEAATDLSLEVVDHPLVAIGYGTTSSYAAAGGDSAEVATGHHHSVSGADLAFSQSLAHKGANYEMSTQTIFAVDFKHVPDLELSFEREAAVACRGKLALAEGTLATARSDVGARGDGTFTAAFADTLAEHDTLALAYSEGLAITA